MPQQFSEKFVVKRKPMGESDVIVKNRDGLNNSLDISEFAYSNSELVNFENAAVNIDNSNDVIIGPVTQFNVNGNVTIVQNGQQEDLINEKAAFEKIAANNKFENAKLPKTEKAPSEDQDAKFLLDRKKLKILVIVLLVMLLATTVAVTLVLLLNTDIKEHVEPSEQGLESEKLQPGLGGFAYLTKKDWDGVPAKFYTNMTHPVRLVVIKHIGAGAICKYFRDCASRMITLQSTDISRGFPDIYCSFFVGGDGNIYVGRGWDVQPQYKNDTIDIVFSGNFEIDKPLPIMLQAAQALMVDGVINGKLAKDFMVVAHNQTVNTRSPGVNLYKEIKKWDHYNSGLFFGKNLPARA